MRSVTINRLLQMCPPCAPVTAPCVIYRLGTGANGTMGGNLAYTESTSITFDTTVNAGIPAGNQYHQ